MKTSPIVAALLLALGLTSAMAQDRTLNIYSARHYPTDEALYGDFTRATGIKINRVDADDAGILARLRAEGAASPADVILLVDASRLWRAEVDGLFQPIRSKVLERHPRQPARQAGGQRRHRLVWPVHPRPGGGVRQGTPAGQRCGHL